MKPSTPTRAVVLTLLCALLTNLPGTPARAEERDRRGRHDEQATRTPIKHVIVIIGENRTFDNVYATYVPRHGQSVANLLSRGIVRADGSPGPNAAAARQFQLARIDPPSYFISTDKLVAPGKAAYATPPTPEAGNAPPLAVTLPQFLKAPAPSAPPFDAKTFSPAQLQTISPVIEAEDLHLLTTSAHVAEPRQPAEPGDGRARPVRPAQHAGDRRPHGDVRLRAARRALAARLGGRASPCAALPADGPRGLTSASRPPDRPTAGSRGGAPSPRRRR